MKKSITRFIQTCCKVYAACFIFILAEWLFFVTKASILTYFTTGEKVSILFLLPLLIFIGVLPFVVILFAIDEWLIKKGSVQLVQAVPVLIYAGVIFLLLENFTNTMFGFFSGSFLGPARYVYLIAFAGFCVYLYQRLTGAEHAASGRLRESAEPVLVAASLVVGVLFAISARTDIAAGPLAADFSSDSRRPNILILSSDGINRRNMSAYGYARETTPFIQSLMEHSLVSANHFANSSHTAASVISLLTGKLPTSTRVVYPPDQLRGPDSYEHLPGILQKLGYTNADISVRYYADTMDLNLLEGFQVANDRSNNENFLAGLYSPLLSMYPAQAIFFRQSLDRLNSRLLHISGIRDIEDVYGLVTSADDLANSVAIDDRRIQQLFDFISDNSEPFFVHLHLMGTHGPRFNSPNPLYSLGQEQTENHMLDFYDDAIRDFDRHVAEIYRFLEARGVLDRTLVIINSDHSRNPNVGLPVPLIMDFPGEQFTGVIESNTQRLDLAPTILDYLGVDVPAWMEGQSLLSLDEDQRMLFAFSAASLDYVTDLGWTVLDPRPPFYTLNSVYVLNCQRIYQLHIGRQNFSNRLVPDHAHPCAGNELHTPHEIAMAILNHLEERDYATGSLGWLTDVVPDVEAFLSISRATLQNGVLYIPAVEYQEGIYAVVLKQQASGDFLIDDLQASRNTDEIYVLNPETRSILLDQADVDGETRNLRLNLVSTNPGVFSLTVEE